MALSEFKHTQDLNFWVLQKKPVLRTGFKFYFYEEAKILLSGGGDWNRTSDTAGMNRML